MRTTIAATGLTTFEVAPEGEEITLHMMQSDGSAASLRLPLACLTQLLMTLPEIQAQALRARHGDPNLRIVYPVGPWTLEASNDPAKVILTLSTADGFTTSFALPAQDIVEMSELISKTLHENQTSASPH